MNVEQKEKFNWNAINAHCGDCTNKEDCVALQEFKESPPHDGDIIPCLVCDLLDIPRGSKYPNEFQGGELNPNWKGGISLNKAEYMRDYRKRKHGM